MYFTTHSSWMIKNPLFKIFDSGNDYMRWNFVEMRLSIYYFHINFIRNFVNSPTTILCANLPATLYLLKNFPDSSLYLQIPALLNDGNPSLDNVVAIYNCKLSNNDNYIAKCATGKIYNLNLYKKYTKSKFDCFNKVLVWSSSDNYDA